MEQRIIKSPMQIENKHKRALIYSAIFNIFFCAGIAMYTKWRQTGTPFVPETILVFFIMLLLGTATTFLAFLVFFKYIEKKPHSFRQVIPALLLFYAGVYVFAQLSITLGTFVWFLVQGRNLTEFFPHLLKYELSAPSANLMLWLLVITLIFFYVLWTRAIEREQKLREEQLIFKYQTLNNQVNPHFLFNSLNTLSSFLSTAPELAETFINKFSSIYRYILEHKEAELVLLTSEIEFARNYFYLHKIRDEEKIELIFSIKNAEKYKILPISLQILVENVLKHNLATREHPLKIEISEEHDNCISVKNNLQRKATVGDSARIGLKNLAERTRLITNRNMTVVENEKEFIVTLPLVV